MTKEEMKTRVLELLDALVGGDRRRLKGMLASDCSIVFPGFKAAGHSGVDQLFTLLDQAFDGCPTKTYDMWIIDDNAAAVSGTLRGRFKDGRPMDGTRYTDHFHFDGSGKVTHWLVWNELALIS